MHLDAHVLGRMFSQIPEDARRGKASGNFVAVHSSDHQDAPGTGRPHRSEVVNGELVCVRRDPNYLASREIPGRRQELAIVGLHGDGSEMQLEFGLLDRPLRGASTQEKAAELPKLGAGGKHD